MSDPNPSIMPLVEENRKLHDELRALKQEMTEQQVRWDEYLTQAPTIRNAVKYLDVHLEFGEVLTLERSEIRDLLNKKLAESLNDIKPFYTVKELGGGVMYRYAVFAGRK